MMIHSIRIDFYPFFLFFKFTWVEIKDDFNFGRHVFWQFNIGELQTEFFYWHNGIRRDSRGIKCNLMSKSTSTVFTLLFCVVKELLFREIKASKTLFGDFKWFFELFFVWNWVFFKFSSELDYLGFWNFDFNDFLPKTPKSGRHFNISLKSFFQTVKTPHIDQNYSKNTFKS